MQQRHRWQLGTTRKTVKRWHDRFIARRQADPDKPVRMHLGDADREGAPPRIPEEAWVDILSLCTTDPESLGLPFSHWSTRELERQVIERQILPRIDHSTIHRFLSSADVKPHRARGFMNRKEDPEFETRATKVKQVLCEAAAGTDPTHAVLSYDEKSGMQAKERRHADRPLGPGRPVRQEYEYCRHGLPGPPQDRPCLWQGGSQIARLRVLSVARLAWQFCSRRDA